MTIVKTLYIVPNLSREGGVSRSILRVRQHLEKIGQNIHVFCPDFEAGQAKASSPIENFYADIQGERLQTWTQRCLEEIERVQPDLLIGYFARTTGFCAVAAGKLKGLPVIVSLRGNDLNLDFFSSTFGPRLLYTLNNATCITTVSTEMKEKVKAWYGLDAHFVSNSVEKDTFFYDQEAAVKFAQKWELEKKPVVSLVGEFKSASGLPMLLEWEEALSECQVLIIGIVRKRFTQYIPSWAKHISYLDDVNELRGAYSASSIILKPALFDGMPNVVLEAMACERSIIASPVGGIKDLIQDGENGYLCRSAEEWNSRIKTLLDKPNPQFGKNACQAAPEPDQEAQQFLEVMKIAYEK